MKKVLLCLLGLLFVSGTKLYAYDFHSGGIYYNILDGNKVEVTSGDAKYEGNIVIPEKVTYNGKSYIVTCIGYDAFHGCSNLTSITIPNSVTSIGLFAFANCSGLTSVSIPNSVTSIGSSAFLSCSGLTSVTIPNSVTRIGDRAFSGTAWYDQKADGLVYAGKVVYTYKGEIPSSISIEEGTLGIADAAFYGCSGLTSVTIPNSVTSIGDRAFQSCSGLTSVTIPNSVTSIGYSVFDYCSGLTSISIPNSVTSIGPNAFSYCSGLTSISIPNSVTSIGSSAFHNCSNLTSITIPNSVTSIGSHAFSYCSGLNDVISEIKTPFGISETVFSVYSTAKLTVPNGTKSSYKSTAGWNKFTNIVEFTNSGDNTGTKRTIHVATAGTLPNLISESEKYNIEELTLTGELNGTDFRLIRDMAGNNYKGEKTAGKLAVLDFSRAKIIAGGDKYLDTNSGTFSYTVDKNDILPQHVFRGCKFISITIPSSVTNIGNSAFFNCIALTSIIIPNSVTSIASRAFQYCSGLTSITIPNSVTSIGDSVFYHCSGLTSITIPNSVTSIGESAFEDCSGLTYIIIPNSVTSIGDDAFRGCSGLTSITIPSSVTSIGNSAFGYCSGLTSITIPNSVTSIGNSAFEYCSSLISIVSEIVKPFEIESDVFSNYSTPALIVPKGTKSAYQSTAGWNKFTNIVEVSEYNSSTKRTIHVATAGSLPNLIPNSEKYIIEELTLTGELNGTDFRLLRDMAGKDYNGQKTNGRLKVLDFSGTKIVAGSDIYAEIFGYGGVRYSYTIERNDILPQSVFAGCNFISVKISNSVTGIRIHAFDGCNGLTSVTIPNSVRNIFDYAFSGCSGLTSITIPSSVTSIGDYAFSGCSSLTSIVSEIVKPFAISENVFSDYTKPTLTVPSGTKSAYQSTAGWKKFTNIVEASSGEWREVTKNFDKSIGFKKIRVKNTKTSSSIYCCVFFSTKPNDNTTSDTKYNINYNRLTIGDGVEQDDPQGYIYINTCKSIGDNWYEYEFKQPVYFSHYQSSAPTNQLLAFIEGTGTNEAVTVTAKSYTREYGDDNPSFEYTVSGGSISGTPKITCSATKTSAVGTYTIKIEKGSVTNSNVTFVDGTLTITKAPLTITAKSYTRKQGESNPTFDVTYSGFKNDETASVLTQKPTCSTTATSSSSPGTYDITVSGASATNYDISYVNGKLTVTQAEAVIVTAVSYTREYGEDNPKFSYTTSGAVLTGTPSITCSATKTSPVGTYPIKIVQGSVSNYNVTYVDGTLTITKAPLTITAKSYTRKQGESNPTFDVTYSGFKNGENSSVLSRQPSCITTAVSSSPPGTYDIIVSGASATNYDISYVKGVLTVTQADAITVTARSYTREYGDDNPTFDYTTSGGSLNGTPTIICSATRTSPVGTYPIRITQGSERNYNVTYVDGTLTITKAPLTITAKSYKREEGTANPTFEVSYSGFKNGETESVLSKKPTLTTTATIDSKPGDYPITASGAEARNYQISYMSGKLTVTEKNEVKFTSQGVSYIGTNATRTAEIEVVASDITELEVPQSVINDGKTYQVTSVSNGALSNRKFNYVALPSTITSLNANTFYNSVLGALIWKADASLSSNVFSYMAMPTLSNFLLYVNSKSYAPSNVTNVVVGNTASNIILADGTNTWFYCPMAFTAQSVTYTHHYGMLTGGNGKGWETISLPYDVQKIEHKSKGVLTPFVLYNDMMTQRPFWLYEFGSNGFSKTDVIKANTPYIIAMPNDSKYDEEYILVGDVTFSATNAQIHKTESLVMPSSNGKTFVPAFTVVDSSSPVYALNVNNNMASYAGSYDAGSRFISNLRDVYPFEAYMTTSSSSARTLGIDFADGTTGIDEIPMAGNGERVKVYSLSGLLLIDSEQSEWESLWQQLPSGVYIVNGKKTIK